MPADIVILSHRDLSFVRQNYFLRGIAEIWREAGHRVRVLDGPQPARPPADLCVVHVDLTRVPKDHLDFARGYRRTVNAWGVGAADVSKRLICAGHLVRRGEWGEAGGWRGPVVVKTDANSGGAMEARLAARGLGPAQTFIEAGKYPVYHSGTEVPAECWENEQLVVERLLPELDETGSYYRLRSWVFCGGKETHTLWYGEVAAGGPVMKSSRFVRREQLAEVPEAIVAQRRRLGLDFGKFDYLVPSAGGEPVLIDANRTPTLGVISREVMEPRIRLLASGLEGLLA